MVMFSKYIYKRLYSLSSGCNKQACNNMRAAFAKTQEGSIALKKKKPPVDNTCHQTEWPPDNICFKIQCESNSSLFMCLDKYTSLHDETVCEARCTRVRTWSIIVYKLRLYRI